MQLSGAEPTPRANWCWGEQEVLLEREGRGGEGGGREGGRRSVGQGRGAGGDKGQLEMIAVIRAIFKQDFSVI